MALAADTVRPQIDRLVRSKTFENSEIHRHLLLYLAEKSLAGEADRLKEYTVGLEAFGKPPSYDPRQDSIVRLQVGRVRQKLMAYYQSEAAPDEPIVKLPKGGFRLDFEPPPAEKPAAPLPHRRLTAALAAALVLAAAWAVVATAGWVRLRRSNPTLARTSEFQALWDPFLQSDRSVLICLGTPLFVRFPNFGFFRDPKTNDWSAVETSERMRIFGKALGAGDPAPAYSFTGTGEAGAAFLLGKFLAPHRPDVLLTHSNLLSWQQITDHNVIFLGPPKFNPQLQAAVMTQDLVMEPEGIRNLKPRAGEPVFLRDNLVAGQAQGETHAMISRMPGINGAGELLVIAGNASADTLAGTEWITQPWHAKELVDRLRGPSGAVPRYFQVVIKVAFQQRIPVRSAYVFHHALPDPASRALSR